MVPHLHQRTVVILIASQFINPQTRQCHPFHIIIEVIPEVFATITAMFIPVIKSRQERFHDVFIQMSLIFGIVCVTDISIDHDVQCMSLRPSAATARACRFSGFRCIRFFPVNASAKGIPSAGILIEIFDISSRTFVGCICPVHIRHIFTG